MFIINLTYIKPIEEIEHYLPAHVEFLKHHYTLGHFLASGRKNPRTGGIIIAAVDTQSELEEILSHDPFHAHQLANYDIIDFTPSMTAPCLKDYKEF